MIPHRTPFFLPLLYPSLHWRMATEHKTLYLTFDDGPVPGPTEFALETLARHNAKATFFCIGDNVQRHASVFAKVHAQGHAIGNHTFHHLNGWRVTAPEYSNNIALCTATIEQQSGTTPNLFRPPYGRITRAQIKTLAQYKIIMWDVLARDYDKSLSPERCLRNTLGAARPGSIVVFHDSVKAEKNMSFALPRMLEHFSAQGYSFKTLA